MTPPAVAAAELLAAVRALCGRAWGTPEKVHHLQEPGEGRSFGDSAAQSLPQQLKLERSCLKVFSSAGILRDPPCAQAVPPPWARATCRRIQRNPGLGPAQPAKAFRQPRGMLSLIVRFGGAAGISEALSCVTSLSQLRWCLVQRNSTGLRTLIGHAWRCSVAGRGLVAGSQLVAPWQSRASRRTLRLQLSSSVASAPSDDGPGPGRGEDGACEQAKPEGQRWPERP